MRMSRWWIILTKASAHARRPQCKLQHNPCWWWYKFNPPCVFEGNESKETHWWLKIDVLLKASENRRDQHQTRLVRWGFQTNNWTLKGRHDHMCLRSTWSLYEEFSEAHFICFFSGWGCRAVIGVRIATQRHTARHSDALRLDTKAMLAHRETICPTIHANQELTTSSI
jgi:hypothetical protein